MWCPKSGKGISVTSFLFRQKTHYKMKYLAQSLLFILSLAVSLIVSQLFFILMGMGLTWISSFNSIFMLVLLYLIGFTILTFISLWFGVGMTWVANRIRIMLLRNLAVIGAVLMALVSAIIRIIYVWKNTDASLSGELILALVISGYSISFVFFTFTGIFMSKTQEG